VMRADEPEAQRVTPGSLPRPALGLGAKCYPVRLEKALSWSGRGEEPLIASAAPGSSLGA
jgi:hypothetical protein